MKDALMIIGVVLLILLRVAIYYVLAPMILVIVLGFFGIEIGFWLALGMLFVMYLILGLLK